MCVVSFPAQSLTLHVLVIAYSLGQASSWPVITSLKSTVTLASQLSLAVKVSALGTAITAYCYVYW